MLESIALVAIGAASIVALILGLMLVSKILEVRDSHRAVYTFSGSYGFGGVTPDIQENDVKIKRLHGDYIVEFVKYDDDGKAKTVSTVTLKKVDKTQEY